MNISRVWSFLAMFLKFGKIGIVFKSMASFDSDVLMDVGDFESSLSRSDEGTISEDAKSPSDGVYNYGCWH